jgi:hypothetical protein
LNIQPLFHLVQPFVEAGEGVGGQHLMVQRGQAEATLLLG